jgi:hypothetical protein
MPCGNIIDAMWHIVNRSLSLSWFVWSVWFIWLIWFASFNQTDETEDGSRCEVRGFRNFELRPSAFAPCPLLNYASSHAATYRLMLSFLAWLRVCATLYASCIRRRWSILWPNAFSMRRAISGDREALPARRSDRSAANFENAGCFGYA